MTESTDASPAIQNLVAFARALRRAGLTVGTERTLAYCRAAATLGPSDLDDLYWAGRLTLLASRDEIPIYERVFRAFFLGDEADARRHRKMALRLVIEGELPDSGLRASDLPAEETERPSRELALTAASPTEVLRRRSFEEYSEEDHARARRLIAELARRAPRRVSRRTRPARRRGRRPDLIRTLRRSLRTEGEPFERSWRRRRIEPRKLVFVLDVSGSMGAYARALAQFAHAAVQAGRTVEVFAFGTRLTRITPALHSRDPDAALAALGGAVPDWEGGTRIGGSLKTLVERWGRGGPIRGAVVVILSDGLDRGEPEVLATQMERLARLAHAIVWVNPLKGSPEYEPLARGMAAALPHIDRFLAGHNLASLETLTEVLAELD